MPSDVPLPVAISSRSRDGEPREEVASLSVVDTVAACSIAISGARSGQPEATPGRGPYRAPSAARWARAPRATRAARARRRCCGRQPNQVAAHERVCGRVDLESICTKTRCGRTIKCGIDPRRATASTLGARGQGTLGRSIQSCGDYVDAGEATQPLGAQRDRNRGACQPRDARELVLDRCAPTWTGNRGHPV